MEKQDNSDKQNAKFLGDFLDIEAQLKNAIFERDFLLSALKSIAGLEPWIGDRQMKEHFQKVVYGAINTIEHPKPPAFFIGNENGIADIEIHPSDN